MSLWTTIKTWSEEQSHVYLHVPIPPSRTDAPHDDTPLAVYGSYFRLWLKEMSLGTSRRWFRDWYPAVRSTVKLQFGGREAASFSHIARAPEGALARSVLLDFRVTQLLPWNGGVLEIEAALLALKGSSHLGVTLGHPEGLLRSGDATPRPDAAGRRADLEWHRPLRRGRRRRDPARLPPGPGERRRRLQRIASGLFRRPPGHRRSDRRRAPCRSAAVGSTTPPSPAPRLSRSAAGDYMLFYLEGPQRARRLAPARPPGAPRQGDRSGPHGASRGVRGLRAGRPGGGLPVGRPGPRRPSPGGAGDPGRDRRRARPGLRRRRGKGRAPWAPSWRIGPCPGQRLGDATLDELLDIASGL